GSGSIGGKGRGIAFFNSLLHTNPSLHAFKGVRIKTPHSFVICSEVFEEFVESNKLQEMAINTEDADEISNRFLASALPEKITEALRTLISEIDYPLAVRSSSILEDSHSLPFAGIYSTYVLPNNHPDPAIRLKQLSDAVKLIYASVFNPSAKRYISNSDMRVEDEKMAVLIQELAGARHGDAFYPAISGVAQSYNFYPLAFYKPEEGIASIAIGLGKAVVEGEQVYRFSPASPDRNPPFSSTAEFLKKTQNHFYALDMSGSSVEICPDQSCTYSVLDLERAEEDGILQYVGSTYSRENDMIQDTLSIPGPRVVTFARILKYGLFPLHEILNELFAILKDALGSDVEIEFAVNIPEDRSKDIEFHFLQVRPMVAGNEMLQTGLPTEIELVTSGSAICCSSHTIGNGVFEGIYDLIHVVPESFSTLVTRSIAAEIGQLNRQLFSEDRRCILISMGRLGTSDPFLGIPLDWSQMSQAKVVVEADSEKLQADPSLGSHFHHNLVSLRMGYLHAGKNSEAEYVDWKWLESITPFRETAHVRHLRFETPITVRIDGHTNRGVILKP
ncbi:MAG: phosphoenolpyruvate synthase, partial [Clostridiales bacterium]|nr:phosphoenolpyruvate synthase [Clostridiales bacterium]